MRAARTATPPTTPPTIAPMGVDFEDLEGGVGLGLGLGPAFEVEVDDVAELVDLDPIRFHYPQIPTTYDP